MEREEKGGDVNHRRGKGKRVKGQLSTQATEGEKEKEKEKFFRTAFKKKGSRRVRSNQGGGN